MHSSMIVNPDIQQVTSTLRVLVAEINRWLVIEGVVEEAIGKVSARCAEQISELRRELLKAAGDSALLTKSPVGRVPRF